MVYAFRSYIVTLLEDMFIIGCVLWTLGLLLCVPRTLYIILHYGINKRGKAGGELRHRVLTIPTKSGKDS